MHWCKMCNVSELCHISVLCLMNAEKLTVIQNLFRIFSCQKLNSDPIELSQKTICDYSYPWLLSEGSVNLFQFCKCHFLFRKPPIIPPETRLIVTEYGVESRALNFVCYSSCSKKNLKTNLKSRWFFQLALNTSKNKDIKYCALTQSHTQIHNYVTIWRRTSFPVFKRIPVQIQSGK